MCEGFKGRILPLLSKLESSYVSDLNQEWQEAKTFANVPGPTKFQMFRGFMKGGDFHGKSIQNLMQVCRQRYGNIFLLPGMFGKPTNVVTFNLDDYAKIIRTEGIYPIRPSNEIIYDYRMARKDGLYSEMNLGLAGDGAHWGKFRQTVNPVLLHPRNAVLYLDPIQKVTNDFIERIRKIRDSTTLEVPGDFLTEIKHFAFESVAAVAFDKDLGLVRKDASMTEAQKLFDDLEDFNKAMYELGMKPSIYKYYKTPTYKRFEKAMDHISNICCEYANESLQRIAERGEAEGEGKSVLEQLVKINPKIAVTMMADMIIAGIETASSAICAILLCLATHPEKQQKLRQEVLSVVGRTDKFTMENLKRMPYLKACIKESLRLYPVLFGNVRTTGMDLCLSSYQIPKGTNVFMASNMLLQDEKYFPQPQIFVPERWLRTSAAAEEDLKSSNPFVFLPYGYGPRSCVGRRIVGLEMQMMLANIVRNFQMEFNYSKDNAFENYFLNICVLPLKFKFKNL
ncbi:probable cytochrome P450 12c1, mitochondrial [Stomoxys calcitrans]|uniref:probable cytochrome P450 12c1, mitochondrial n=1 Tax=Stomoxys calcitrans TaxID=35570 RepID=UPI0027E2A1D2|nr:probable cytochrome P450 12c1, mitochondrial [Stomoxys calcitrans]